MLNNILLAELEKFYVGYVSNVLRRERGIQYGTISSFRNLGEVRICEFGCTMYALNTSIRDDRACTLSTLTTCLHIVKSMDVIFSTTIFTETRH